MSEPNDAQQKMEAIAEKNFNEFFRQWWFSIVVMAVIITTSFFPQQWVHNLALIHDAISQGEYWRLISSQFVHLGSNHTLLNLVGYLIVAASFREDISPREEALSLLICCLGVGLGIYWFNPEIGWYVGLSGAIYGILTHFLIVGWQRSPFLSLFFGVFLAGKFIYEQFISGPDTFTAGLIGAQVAIDSHLYGAITGLATGLIALSLHRQRQKPEATKD